MIDMNEFYVREGLRLLHSTVALSARMPRAKRIRRRGFSPTVRRGAIVSHAGKRWNVSRRSNWHLWLYEHVPMRKGATITVTVPKRYEAAR
jgi:hypothetical protein